MPSRTASLSSSHAGAADSTTSDAASFQSVEPSAVTPPSATVRDGLRLTSRERRLLQRWILSIGCVTFDLELGPDLEFLYPPLGISKEEKDNIAFSSFPDTSIFDDGFTTFSWRVREVPLHSSESAAPVIGGISSLNAFASPAVEHPSLQSASAAIAQATGQPVDGTTTDASGKLLPAFLSEAHNSSPSKTPVQLARKKSSIFERARGAYHARSDSATSGEATDAANAEQGGSAVGNNSMAEVDIRSSLIMRELELQSAGGLVVEGSGSTAQVETRAPAPAAASGAAVPIAAAAPRRGGGSTSSSYIYGVCFFRQKRDPSIRRGYFQKSVVILSHLPYVSLLTELVSKLGPVYFEHGQPMLEAFAREVMNWPAPEPGATLSLPVLGSVLDVSIPIGAQFQGDAASNAYIPSATNPSIAMSLLSKKKVAQSGKPLAPEPILASIPSTYLIDTFRECLPDLWLLWESMLLADPILVIGPEPKACSEAVWHLLDLIRPVPFAGDFRPYFHMHDYDCRALVTKNKPQAGTVLGVTNPFFLTSCGHWPNILRVGKAAARNSRSGPLGLKKSAAPAQPGIAGGMGAGGGGPEHQPGLNSKRKRRASKDRQLLKAVIDAVEKQEGGERYA